MPIAKLLAATLITACAMSSAQAAIIDLTITATWEASDFDVSSTGPSPGAIGIPEEDDDLVFGVAPSAGSTSFTLRVNTSPVVSFSSGDFGVTHDWFGYSDVQLVGTHTFGTASWTTSDILTALEGPNGSSAALWVDTDLSVAAPSLISFRMQGDWTGEAADLFVGSRSPTTIGTQFLMWEYFAGEEIRNDGLTVTYGATPANVPAPATLALLVVGLAGVRARRAAAHRAC